MRAASPPLVAAVERAARSIAPPSTESSFFLLFSITFYEKIVVRKCQSIKLIEKWPLMSNIERCFQFESQIMFLGFRRELSKPHFFLFLLFLRFLSSLFRVLFSVLFSVQCLETNPSVLSSLVTRNASKEIRGKLKRKRDGS